MILKKKLGRGKKLMVCGEKRRGIKTGVEKRKRERERKERERRTYMVGGPRSSQVTDVRFNDISLAPSFSLSSLSVSLFLILDFSPSCVFSISLPFLLCRATVVATKNIGGQKREERRGRGREKEKES